MPFAFKSGTSKPGTKELLRHSHGDDLMKEGPLRLTVIAIAPGGDMPMHSTEGPVTVHVLEGDVLFEAF